MIWKRNSKKFLVYFLLIIFAILSFLPMFTVFFTAISSESITLGQTSELFNPKNFTFDNFEKAIKLGNFLFYFRNTLIITISASILSLIICIPFSYGMTKLSKKVKGNIGFLVMSMRFIPFMVLAFPFFLIFLNYGIVGTHFAVILAHLSLHIPIVSWLLIGFFEEIPREIEESARVDGCNSFLVFLKISVPIAKPGIITAAILTFFVSWNDYLFGLFLAGDRARPLTVAINYFMGYEATGPEHNVIAAYSFLMLVPILLFTVFTSRYIVKGFARGAVKG